MYPAVTLVLGGAAAGKSVYAESLLDRTGSDRVFLATAQSLDAEMDAKIAVHRERRGDGWKTIESPFETASVLASLGSGQICLLDCATLWLSNHLLAGHDLATERGRLLGAIADCRARLVIVSNEVGHGIVPDNALARRFREEQGRLNVELAARADRVVQVVAGLPQALKGRLP